MAFTAYATCPPDGLGDFLAGFDVTNSEVFLAFHRAELVDARVADCGQPSRPDLHRSALFERTPKHPDDHWFYKGRRFVYCPDGHPLKLDRNPSGQGFHFRHWPGQGAGGACRYDDEKPVPESEEHRRLKHATAEAYDRAGMNVHVERRTRSLRSQPDVTADYQGRRYGLEIQLSDIEPGHASRRTRLLREEGCMPIWSSTRSQQRWQRHVPFLHTTRRNDVSADDYYVMVRSIVRFPCKGQCWRKRATGDKTCPGHLQAHITGGRERFDSGPRHGRVQLGEFAHLLARGDVREARLPNTDSSSGSASVITWAEEAHLADDEFAEYCHLRGDMTVDDVRPRRPYCSKRYRGTADPADLDLHGELDARVDLDRDLIRGEQITFRGDDDVLHTGMVRSINRNEFGQCIYDVRYIDTDELGRTVYGQQDVTLDQVATVRV